MPTIRTSVSCDELLELTIPVISVSQVLKYIGEPGNQNKPPDAFHKLQLKMLGQVFKASHTDLMHQAAFYPWIEGVRIALRL